MSKKTEERDPSEISEEEREEASAERDAETVAQAEAEEAKEAEPPSGDEIGGIAIAAENKEKLDRADIPRVGSAEIFDELGAPPNTSDQMAELAERRVVRRGDDA